MLQRHKTKIYDSEEFGELCLEMIQDRPINQDEKELLTLIKKYSGGNPYKTIFYSQISESDWQSISEETIETIIGEYISEPDVDYIRLRWFYRRLSQIGHPGAINISLKNIDRLGPCFSNICFYLSSVQSIEAEQWKSIGQDLLNLLDLDEVKSNEYFRISILSLFSRNEYINHFSELSKIYNTSDQFVRREIFLAAKANSGFDWLREFKENFTNLDPWQKMAFLYCTSGFPKDEKKYFINRLSLHRPFEKILGKWSKSI